MNLFNQGPPEKTNLLPYDGCVRYFGPIVSVKEAEEFLQQLLVTVDWQPDVAVLFGKRIETKRKVAWYGDQNFPYTYSGNTKIALEWNGILTELKNRTELLTSETFNSCLLNLYHDGSEGMAWHSDGEKELKKNGTIASWSLGAERKFSFKHKKTNQRVDVFLQNGSLMTMEGITQENWLHRLPPTKKIHQPRINLTFRQIDTASKSVHKSANL